MIDLAPGWKLDLDRGPDWLFVRLHCTDANQDAHPPLAEKLWSLLRQSFTSRMVLELDEVERLRSWTMGQLVNLNQRVSTSGGILRLCGLSETNCSALKANKLDHCLSIFSDRHEAVGFRPRNPR